MRIRKQNSEKLSFSLKTFWFHDKMFFAKKHSLRNAFERSRTE